MSRNTHTAKATTLEIITTAPGATWYFRHLLKNVGASVRPGIARVDGLLRQVIVIRVPTEKSETVAKRLSAGNPVEDAVFFVCKPDSTESDGTADVIISPKKHNV